MTFKELIENGLITGLDSEEFTLFDTNILTLLTLKIKIQKGDRME
jgi:hypothetical protein